MTSSCHLEDFPFGKKVAARAFLYFAANSLLKNRVEPPHHSDLRAGTQAARNAHAPPECGPSFLIFGVDTG